MDNQLQTQAGGAPAVLDTRITVEQVIARRQAIVECMKRTMVQDIDYGKVPGTDKPSLWKPGSEKLLNLFQYSCTPRVEDLSTPDTIRYRVYAVITHIPTGLALGEGIGEASSAESKYQWRAPIGGEWLETAVDRRREKWKKGWGDKPAFKQQQVRSDVDDVANTVLKIAKKRAQIDATLTACAASDVFAQDLEDLRDVGLEDIDPADRTAGELQKKAAPAATGSTSTGPAASTSTASTAAETSGKPPVEDDGPPKIDPGMAKRFWGKAMDRLNDHKAVITYLKETHGVYKKDDILASRANEAMQWAEYGIKTK